MTLQAINTANDAATDRTVSVAPLFAPPAAYYAAIARARAVVIDTNMPYDHRRKSPHRTLIVDTRGPLMLSIPIVRPRLHTPLSQLIVSDHGRWWNIMLRTLESAYGRTPYFEFIFPLLSPLVNAQTAGTPLISLTLAVDAVIRGILGITARATLPAADIYTDTPAPGDRPRDILTSAPGDVTDLRALDFNTADIGPYPQHHAATSGYVPHTSILDALFTLGPENTRALISSGGRKLREL